MVIQINPQSIAACEPASTAAALQALRASPHAVHEALALHLDAASSSATRHAYIRLFADAARQQAAQLALGRTAALPCAPLAGLSVSIKDLFDVAGHPATGGSATLSGEHSVLTGTPAADTEDAAAVARLRAAGCLLLGHTNLSEFAFSGVGLNPHHGTPVNPVALCIDPDTPRLPGGSTSGGAVSVAAGAAWAALGSDTGGSIRIPAALHGLVGFKPTQGTVSRDGCIPLSPTLDTACAITPDVLGACVLQAALSHRAPAPRPGRPLSATRLAVPTDLMLDDLEPAVARAFERSLSALARAGAQLVHLPIPELLELPALQARASFAAAESWAWHRQRLSQQGNAYDPRVAARIQRGESISAADYLDLQQARRHWITRVNQRLRGFDAALSPTVPCVAPPLAPLLTDDTLFFATNAALLRNPSVINFLDGCALSLPCQQAGDLPVGLMVWATSHQDAQVLDTGLAIEAALQPLRQAV